MLDALLDSEVVELPWGWEKVDVVDTLLVSEVVVELSTGDVVWPCVVELVVLSLVVI